MPRTLSHRLDLFALNVALGRSLEQAALEAGYAAKTARHSQSRLLATAGVKEAVERHRQRLQEAGEQINVTPEWIIGKLAEVANRTDVPAAQVSALRTLADVQGLLGGSGTTLPPSQVALLEAIGMGARIQQQAAQNARAELAEPVESREVTDSE